MQDTITSWKETFQTQHFLPYLMQVVPPKKLGVILSDSKTRFFCQPGHFDDIDFVEAFHEKGYEVIVVDWNQITLENALEVAQWASFIIPRSCWDYVNNVERFCAIMGIFSQHGNLLNPWKFGVLNTSKGLYLREAARYGIPITPTVWLDVHIELHWENYFSEFGTTLFLKPQRGSGAKGCLKVTKNNLPEAIHLIHEYWNQGVGMMIQPCLEFSVPERKLVFIGGKFSHGITQDKIVATNLNDVLFYKPTAEELALGYLVVELVCRRAGISPEELPFLRVDIFIGENGNLYVNEFSVLEDQGYFRKAPGAIERFVEVILRLIHNNTNSFVEETHEQHTAPLGKLGVRILNILTAIVKIPFLLLRS